MPRSFDLLSIDTNILLYSLNEDCHEFSRARAFIDDVANEELVLCELVLVELYLLLRNPKVLATPYSSRDAVNICEAYRSNPKWRLVDAAPIMQEVWQQARTPAFPRRRIIDARLAFTLRHHGVSQFATRNIKDFKPFGFTRLWNPLVAS